MCSTQSEVDAGKETRIQFFAKIRDLGISISLRLSLLINGRRNRNAGLIGGKV